MFKDRFTKKMSIGVGVIVASIAIAAIVLDLLSNNISAQVNTIAADRALVQENTNAVTYLAQLKEDAPQAASYQTAMDQLLPNQDNLATFSQWLAQLGGKYDVAADAIFQGAATPSAGTLAGTAQFSFDAAGTSNDLVAFLDGMNAHSSEFIVSLTSFNVTSDGINEKITGQGTVFSQ